MEYYFFFFLLLFLELQFDSEKKDLLGMECATLRCKVDLRGILFDVERIRLKIVLVYGKN